MGAVRVYLLDDHEVAREGVRRLLEADPVIEVVGEGACAEQAVPEIVELKPDVAMLDVRLPDGSGVEVARHIRSVAPLVRCVIFTAYSEEDAFLKSVLAGAVGFLLKTASGEELRSAVRRAAAGESLIDEGLLDRLRSRALPEGTFRGVLGELTPHERRILAMVVEGYTNREIADHLHLAEKTIRNTVSGILGKVGARNRTQLAVYAAGVLTQARS